VHPRIEAVLAADGVITSADFPSLASTLRRLERRGVLACPFPGVFVAAPQTPLSRLRAISRWSAPLGTLHGSSAVGLWLPSATPAVTQLAHPTLRSRPGVAVSRRIVPADFIVTTQGVRAACPAYGAAELAAVDDGRVACEALRLGLATPDDLALAAAALAGSRGQVQRRRAIAACADNPWSYAELRLHRILRSAGIRSWIANRPVEVGGRVFRPDARFRAERVVIEVDGRATHEAPAQFRLDRERQNALTAAGYVVIRFTWEHLDDPAYVVGVVRDVLRLRQR
jgi:very-short-patch-repair endonuclease